MKVVSLGRHFLVIATGVFLLVAIVLTVVAIVTPAWQTVYLAEFNSEHEHGLWMDCTMVKRSIHGTGHHAQCTYKFENPYLQETGGVHPEEEQHKFHDWHKAVLTLFGVAILSATTALCFSFCALCIRLSALVTNVTAFIGASAAILAQGVFFISSHRNDIRFVQGITVTYEQTKGYSFYIGFAAVVAYIIAFIVSILATVFVFLHDRQQHSAQNKTFPKNAVLGNDIERQQSVVLGSTSVAI